VRAFFSSMALFVVLCSAILWGTGEYAGCDWNTGCVGLEKKSPESVGNAKRRVGDALQQLGDAERALDNSDLETTRRSLQEVKRILQQIVAASPDSFGDT